MENNPLPPDTDVVLQELLRLKSTKWFGKITLYMEDGRVFRYTKEESVVIKDVLARRPTATSPG